MSGNSYSAIAQGIQILGLDAAAYAVDTWKGDPHTGTYSEDIFQDWSAFHDQHFSGFSSLIRSTFDEALGHFADGSIDLLHIDGTHTIEAVRHDFESWLPKLSSRAIVLFHDINVHERDFGVWKLWQDISREYPCFGFLHGHGLGVAGVGRDLPGDLRILLEEVPRHGPDSYIVREFFGTIGAALVKSAQDGESTRREAALRDGLATATAEIERLTAAAQVAEAARLRGQQDAAGRLDRVEGRAQEMAALESTVDALQRARDELQERAVSDRTALDSAERRADAWFALLMRYRASWSWRGTAGRSEVRPPSPGTRRRDSGLGDRARTEANSILARLRPSRIRSMRAIRRSGLFDEQFYLRQLSTLPDKSRDLTSIWAHPLAHYLLYGAYNEEDPHPLFDTVFYLERNPDVAAAGRNPLEHYLASGGLEGRDPHPLFHTAFYLDQNPEVRAPRESAGPFSDGGRP